MAVAAWAGSVLVWDRELAALKERIGGAFGRMELRRNAGAFIDGLPTREPTPASETLAA